MKDGVAALPWTFLHLVLEFPSDPFLFNSAEISMFQDRERKCLVCTLNSAWKAKYSTVPENNSDLVLEFHKAIGTSSLKDMKYWYCTSLEALSVYLSWVSRHIQLTKALLGSGNKGILMPRLHKGLNSLLTCRVSLPHDTSSKPSWCTHLLQNNALTRAFAPNFRHNWT